MQVEIESSHTDTEKLFFDQDSNMGDQEDKNTRLGGGGNAGPDPGEERFLQLLDTLAQG